MRTFARSNLNYAGTSFLNRTEASNVEKIVTRFLQNGVNPGQIGVITPYEGQRAHVISVMARQGTLRQDLYADIEVSSVDAFQVRRLRQGGRDVEGGGRIRVPGAAVPTLGFMPCASFLIRCQGGLTPRTGSA